MDTDSSSLIDPALVLAVGAVDGQWMLQSPGSGASSKDKKKKVTSEDKPKVPASKLVKLSTDKPAKSATYSRSAKPHTEDGIAALDQKWSNRFN